MNSTPSSQAGGWVVVFSKKSDACQRLFTMPWLSRELLTTHQTLCAVASLPGESGTLSLRFCTSDRQPCSSLECVLLYTSHPVKGQSTHTRRMQSNTDCAIKFRWKRLQQRLSCEKRLLYMICFSFHPIRAQSQKIQQETEGSH